MDEVFTRLSAGVLSPGLAALAAAFGWGVVSVLLSPCHLATIPLIVGFIGAGSTRGRPDRPVVISGLFAIGMFLALAVAGALIALVGQALHAWRRMGAYATAFVLLIAGLHLLGLLPLPQAGTKIGPLKRQGPLAALSAGLLLGIGLSPCTFAFLAPVLGAALSVATTSAVRGFALLLAFALGHCLVIAVAGSSTRLVQSYLDWNERSRGLKVLKATCGALLLVGAASVIYGA